jgi:hypothetical protein
VTISTSLLSLVAAALKLGNALLRFFSERKLIAAGEASGRAAAEREHARAAQRAEDEMRSIADRPASRDQLLRRLDDGSA